jgi:predicted CopG family antitoxin
MGIDQFKKKNLKIRGDIHKKLLEIKQPNETWDDTLLRMYEEVQSDSETTVEFSFTKKELVELIVGSGLTEQEIIEMFAESAGNEESDPE